MSIEEIRHFFLSELPEKIIGFLRSSEDSLSAISPYYYIIVIGLLLIVNFIVFKKVIGLYIREQKKKKALQRLSETRSVQEYVTIMTQFLKDRYPDIRDLGIYIKEQDSWRLINAEITNDEIKASPLPSEVIISDIREFEKRGRYYIYTLAPPDKSVAIKIISFVKIKTRKIKSDLEYIATLFTNFSEKDHLKTELLKTRILNETKDLFSSPSFNKENYFKFIGNIILKAGNLDGVRIISGDKKINIGEVDFQTINYKALKVRNTDINIEIYRRGGISQEDILNTGRFLDLISAMLSFYYDRSIINNFLYFLETAISVFESSDKFYHNHSKKVEIVSITIGEKLGLNDKELENLKFAARLHDIGMIGDIHALTLKDMKLSEKDYGILKYHPLVGSTITASIDSLYPISNIIMQHHELCDGSGYPFSITSENMLTESKILSFSEILVGLLSDRPHRKGYSLEEAVKQISDIVPHKIDPGIFRAFSNQKDTIMQKLENLT